MNVVLEKTQVSVRSRCAVDVGARMTGHLRRSVIPDALALQRKRGGQTRACTSARASGVLTQRISLPFVYAARGLTRLNLSSHSCRPAVPTEVAP